MQAFIDIWIFAVVLVVVDFQGPDSVIDPFIPLIFAGVWTGSGLFYGRYLRWNSKQ